MTQPLVCKRCGTVYQQPPKFCRKCGARVKSRLAIASVKWASWSAATLSWALLSLHVFSFKSCISIDQADTPPPANTSTNNGGQNATTSVSNNNGTVIVTNINYHAPDPPAVPPEVIIQHFVPEAVDKKHKHATFDIYLFSDEYRWMIGRWDMLENGQTEMKITPQMQTNLNSCEEVICIGASSEQIRLGLTPAEGKKEEEDRAARRAETIAKWIRPYLQKHVVVRKLNIGHHAPVATDATPDSTSEQRRVIIVLVLKKETDVDVDEALRDAFQSQRAQHPIYNRILEKYSLTQGPRFAWIE